MMSRSQGFEGGPMLLGELDPSVVARFGTEQVVQTLADANRLISSWKLQNVATIRGATCSLVVSARLDRGASVVLKVPLPEVEERDAGWILQDLGTEGCVSVLEHDETSGAILMPHIHPGTTLSEEGLSDGAMALVCGDLILRLRCEPATHKGFPIEQWFRPLTNSSVGGVLGKAREVVKQLLTSTDKPRMIHGDLHPANILKDGSGWRAIDPKGIFGDPCYEIGALMRNGLSAETTPEAHLDRLRRFKLVLGDSMERLWGWTLGEMALMAVDGDGDSPEKWLTWAEQVYCLRDRLWDFGRGGENLETF